jgi:tetratricopeptide (TPR) repeat protein
MRKMRHGIKKSLILIEILIILPLIYLVYDRSLMPPEPVYKSPPYVQGETWEQYATQFLETSKTPNALEHYLKAYSLFSTSSYIKSEDIYDIQTIINLGWTKPYPKVEKVLEIYHEAIQEIILGAQMHQCEFPPVPFGENRPASQNFMKAQYLSKLIVTSGKKLESENQYHQALQYYLDGIQFGADMGQKGQASIQVLIGITFMHMHIRSILQLISENILTESDYRYLITELNRIEREHPNFPDAVRRDFHRSHQNRYPNKVDNPITYAKEINLYYRIFSATGYLGSGQIKSKEYDEKAWANLYHQGNDVSDYYLAGYIFFNKGRILRNTDNYDTAMEKIFATKTFRELTQVNWKDIVPKDKINRLNTVNIKFIFLEGYRDQMVEISKLRLAKIQAAIQLYHLEKKHWPKGLDDLKSYLSPVPVDPFTDKPFHWTTDSTGKPFAYSVGPDFVDDATKTIYDPTNGTTSQGDICP